jgi:hypothetical protein
MTYFADLTPYVYDESDRDRLNVGWLDADHDYPKSAVDEQLRAALVHLLGFQTNPTRGAHSCPLCGKHMVELIDDHGYRHLLGTGEIHVDGDDGSSFAAPSLIVHYVLDHGYCPPKSFRNAAIEFARFYGLSSPPPADR